MWTGRKEPFGHTGRLETPPRGAVTRRAVVEGKRIKTQGSAQNRANLYAKPFASHETAVELVLAVEEDP